MHRCEERKAFPSDWKDLEWDFWEAGKGIYSRWRTLMQDKNMDIQFRRQGGKVVDIGLEMEGGMFHAASDLCTMGWM